MKDLIFFFTISLTIMAASILKNQDRTLEIKSINSQDYISFNR